jgi:hypothetical protein
MSNFYEDDARLRKLRIANLKKQDALFGAIYAQEQQEAMANSSAIVLNDHSQDLVNVIKQQNDSYNEASIAEGQALQYVRRLTGNDVLAKDIIDDLDIDEHIFIVKNQKLISKELRKYQNLSPADFIRIVVSLKEKGIWKKGEEQDEQEDAPQEQEQAPAQGAEGWDAWDAEAEELLQPKPKKKKVTVTPAKKKTDEIDFGTPSIEDEEDEDNFSGENPMRGDRDVLEDFRNPEDGRYTDLTTILTQRNRGFFEHSMTFRQRRNLYKRFWEDKAEGLRKHDDKIDGKSNGRVLPDTALKLKMIERAREQVGGSKVTTRGRGVRGRGLPLHDSEVSNANKQPVRIFGRGLNKAPKKFKPYRRYYDKVYIDLDKLNDNILYVKYIMNNVSTKIKTQHISDDLKEIIEDTLEDRYNKKIFNTLEDGDKRLFRSLVKTLRLPLELPHDDAEKDWKDKYKVILGSYYSGSDSPEIKKELLKMVREGLALSLLPAHETWSLLYELSA